jgi:4-amino-4-deoxy-L-arabinose transferase-like glycosyltransferase
MSKLLDTKLMYPLLLCLALIPLFAMGLSNHGLWSADEPRVAEIGREMAISGNWAVPMLNGKPFLEEPPLYYASLAAVFRLAGGATDRIARIPSAVFAFGGVIATLLLAWMLFGPRTGFLSAFVLGTSFEYFRVAHWVLVDSALACFVFAAMGCFAAGYFSVGKRARRWLFYGLFYLFCVLAFFVKGFIGLAVPGVAILTFLVLERNTKELFRMHLWFGVVLFIIMVTPWLAALRSQGDLAYLKIFLVDNNLMRFIPGGGSGHQHPFYYYLTEFPAGFLPWSLLLVPTLWYAFSRHDPNERRSLLFVKCWFLAGFILFSIASTKRVLYLLPIFAPVAILTGSFIDAALGAPKLKRLEAAFFWISGLFFAVLGPAALPSYLLLAKYFPLETGARTLLPLGIVSAAVLVFSLFGLLSLRRANVENFWRWLSASLVLLLAFALLWMVPLVDKHKTFVPFCTQVDAAVPADKPLYGYFPDETLRGVIPFYTGRHLEELENTRQLTTLLKEQPGLFVVMRDSRGKQERELHAMATLAELARVQMGTGRALVLFRAAPGQE